MRLKLLQFVSRGQLIKPCTFILHVKKKAGQETLSGPAAAVAGRRCGSEMWQRLKMSVVNELQLLSHDDANAEGLLGQAQEVAVYPR